LKLWNISRYYISEAIKSGNVTFAIYGLGGVGLALVAVWLRAGAKVIGVDLNRDKVEALNRGEVSHPEEKVRKAITDALKHDRFVATTNGVRAAKMADVMIVIVPLTYRKDGPDFSNIDHAFDQISQGLSKGDIVILETSVPPGTTEYRVRNILDEKSGLIAGIDYGLIYSPERVMIGHAVEDIEEKYPKIVSGIDEKSTEIAEAIYSTIAKAGVIRVSSPIVAEFEKLAEGIYRDINIALANELARLARKLNIDFNEVIKAANSQPYSHIHKPGTGVGGLCIPIYPKLLSWTAENLGIRLELTSLARTINEFQPRFVISLVHEGLNLININRGKVKVAILGLAFRGDTPVTSNTPTYVILKGLLESGIKNIVVHDPFVATDPVLATMNIKLMSDLKDALLKSNIVVIVTDHSIYRDLSTLDIITMSGADKIAIIDGRHVIELKDAGGRVLYTGVGRPWIKI